MNAEQKLLCRELLSTAGKNQLHISNALSNTVLAHSNVDLKSIVRRGMAEELAQEMIKRSVIEQTVTSEHYGFTYHTTVWAFTPEQIALFALACFERGVKAGEVAL